MRQVRPRKTYKQCQRFNFLNDRASGLLPYSLPSPLPSFLWSFLSKVKHKLLYTPSWFWFCLQRPCVDSHGSQKPDPCGKLTAHREVGLVSGRTPDCVWDHILWSCLGSWIGTRNLLSEKATLGWGEESELDKVERSSALVCLPTLWACVSPQQNTAGMSNFSLACLEKGPFKEIYFLWNNLYYNVAADRHVRILLAIGGETFCQVVMIFVLFSLCVYDVIRKVSKGPMDHKEIHRKRNSAFIY